MCPKSVYRCRKQPVSTPVFPIVVKWPGSVHDARMFLNSSINGMFRKRIIPPCEKILVEGRDPIPVSLLDDPAYPLLPFLMKKFSGGGRNEGETFFSYKLPSAGIPIENSFGRLKARFGCLQRAMDVKLNTLSQVIYSSFALYNYSENKKENLPDQNLCQH